MESLALKAEFGELARVGQWVSAVAQTWRLPGEVAQAIDVCLEEAVSNVIKHATPERPNSPQTIILTLHIAAPLVRVEIEDTGPAFDPLSIPEPSFAADINAAEVGGLGIHLLRRLTQGLSYERRGDRNRLSLFFPLERAH